MLLEQCSVAALEMWFWWGPCTPACGEFVVADVQMDAARIDVDLEFVAVTHERQGSADVAFRRHMQDHGPVAGSAHAGVGDSQYVTHTFFQQLAWDRQHSPLGHTGSALGSSLTHHQDGVFVDSKS